MFDHLPDFSVWLWKYGRSRCQDAFLSIDPDTGGIDPQWIICHAWRDIRSIWFKLLQALEEPVLPWVALEELWPTWDRSFVSRISSWWLWGSHHKGSYPRCVVKSFTSPKRTSINGTEDCNWRRHSKMEGFFTNWPISRRSYELRVCGQTRARWTSFWRCLFLKVSGSKSSVRLCVRKEQRRSVNHMSWVHFSVYIWSCIDMSFWRTVVWFNMLHVCMSVAQTGLLFAIREKI